MSGIDLLRRMRSSRSEIDVIIITAYGTVETAVEAMREGAFDYVTKPFSPDEVRHRLRQLERVTQLRDEVRRLQQQLGQDDDGESGLVARSTAMQRQLALARTIADTEATVLICGESGTGKTRLARLIHRWSRRGDGPFIVVDCAAFAASLLESELFGHRRGAFTGAVSDKTGRIELAQHGTLFLDEIGELPLELQGKLLRLVEERSYERVGDPRARSMNARIVAATNRDLDAMVAEGRFRQDLYFRLNVVELTLPALRHRVEDIAPLVTRLIARANAKHGRCAESLEPALERFLYRHSWPGNVRELGHAIEHAVLVCSDHTLRLEHLPARLAEAPRLPQGTAALLSLAELEEQHIRAALARNLPLEETARLLGIDPSTLWRKRKKYDL
ncbi:MAG: sigma-54-dependent Fis family transcriptional regulator [Myxococcales bacterium]|nr:sigma-54-dependent Fis family transcriptional regulator [Myxococcales bacterium]